MFQQFYGFTSMPFSLSALPTLPAGRQAAGRRQAGKSIPTDHLFDTVGQKELAVRLTFLVRERGLGLVTGEFGSGKSTAVRAFSNSLDFNRYLVIYLANPTTGITGLYRDTLLHLGHQPPYTNSRMVTAIRTAFDDLNASKRRTPLVIIDEAHLLTQSMLEQLRLLFSDHMDSQSLAVLLLVGHPSLRQTLRLSVHEAFQQRLTVRYHLPPLDLQETLGYVKHHVRVAGYTANSIFTDDAITRVFEYTKGLPRRINQVCTTVLMAGMIDQKSLIDESTVRKAIADLEHE